MRRPNFISEDDLKTILENMGRGELTTGKVSSYSRNCNAAMATLNELGKDVLPVRQKKIVPCEASVAVLGGVSKQIHSGYKNKWEETYAYGLVLEHRAGLIKRWGYEVMTLKLAKGKYHRPDFTIWHLDGSIEQAAVKGYHKNLRDSLTIIKWACKEHPWFRFTINRRDGSAWSKELVKA